VKQPELTFQGIANWTPPARGVASGTPEEIAAGLTADVYFVGSLEVLGHLGLADTPVVAEVFANRAGVLAGVEEVLTLLEPLGVQVEALSEGTQVEARQVVMRIRGPYSRFGVYETALLGMLAASSGWATRAREAVAAAGGRPVISFGARHVHPAVASVLDRAAMTGGAVGASSILGARLAGQLPQGTMPHALILMVGDTLTAAEAFDAVMPPEVPRTVLIDTFKDEGEEALRVAGVLGSHLQSIRLDTPRERGGVTPDLVREMRARLDQAGFRDVGIFCSGGLTPERITSLAEAGATGFGVGSYIAGAPPLDMTMDLKEVDGRAVAKRGRVPGLTPAEGLRPRLPR
jgi:nicotinate phosphoribosyltransferase